MATMPASLSSHEDYGRTLGIDSEDETYNINENDLLREDDATFANIIENVVECFNHTNQTQKYSIYWYESWHLKRGVRSYNELLDRLNRRGHLKFFQSLRSRWDAGSGKLTVIFCDGPIQYMFKLQLDTALRIELNHLAKAQPVLAPLIGRMHVAGSYRRVNRSDDTATQSPTGQIRYKPFHFPGLVYDIIDQQEDKEDKLHQEAYKYFDHWPDAVGAVLRFKFEYVAAYTYNFSICVWTAREAEDDTWEQQEVIHDLVFCRAGQAVSGSLTLPFSLFMPPHQRCLIPAGAGDAFISLDFEDLAQFATDAVKLQRARYDPQAWLRAFKRTRRIDKDGVVTVTGAREPKRERMFH
ncbi:hypothetical protein F5B21DRAFT_455263 [Xylaria acuta]|nr:hypothetical protein F5B21DRAFT_455263 [Xylaria acuta]